jgi:hypothetical protein
MNPAKSASAATAAIGTTPIGTASNARRLSRNGIITTSH